MPKHLRLFTAALASAFGLAACGTTAPPATGAAPATTSHARAHAEIVPVTPPKAARAPGTATYEAKKIGERAGITTRDGSKAVDFWITKISVDPKCDPGGRRTANRETVILDVTVKTYTGKVAGRRLSPFKTRADSINPFSLSTAGTAGPRLIETDRCRTTLKTLPSTFVPGQVYTGQIAFATPYRRGKVQVTQSTGYFENGTVGWEWPY